jgi:hypothetical protein
VSRFTEDLVLAKAGEPPHTLSSLLAALSVRDSPEPERRAAITAWLRDHEPERFLRDQLIDHGYLPDGRQHAA